MKTKDLKKIVLSRTKPQSWVLVMLTMMLAFVMNANAQQRPTSGQQKRMMEFQVMMAMHDTTYKNFIKDGKYKEAIVPLTTLINILDTTTICQDTEISPEMIKAAKADYLYDMACCYALTKQKKQALEALEKSVDSGYKRYDNMLNDNDLSSLRKDKKYQALLAMVKDRQPLSVLKNSAPYAQDSVKMDNPFSCESKESKCLSVVREYFKLDSVAGQGDELSKIINLLHFAHDNMRHDGNNRAFAEMDAWVMDKNGTMLSIAEVRDRLRNDLPLVLCETANWKCDTTTEPDIFWAKPEI